MNNTYGTHVLLEACRMSSTIRRVINVSTDEVYGESSLGAEKGTVVRYSSHTEHDCQIWTCAYSHTVYVIHSSRRTYSVRMHNS